MTTSLQINNDKTLGPLRREILEASGDRKKRVDAEVQKLTQYSADYVRVLVMLYAGIYRHQQLINVSAQALHHLEDDMMVVPLSEDLSTQRRNASLRHITEKGRALANEIIALL
jgi:hypothetical protein